MTRDEAKELIAEAWYLGNNMQRGFTLDEAREGYATGKGSQLYHRAHAVADALLNQPT